MGEKQNLSCQSTPGLGGGRAETEKNAQSKLSQFSHLQTRTPSLCNLSLWAAIEVG